MDELEVQITEDLAYFDAMKMRQDKYSKMPLPELTKEVREYENKGLIKKSLVFLFCPEKYKDYIAAQKTLLDRVAKS